MFEVVVTICAGTLCASALVPGHEAATRAICEAGLSTIDAAPVAGLAGRDLRCQPVGRTLDVQEIAPGVFVHRGAVAEWTAENRGDISNVAIVVGESAVAVIDTGSARWMGEALWRTVRQISDLPLSHVVLSHMHPDHVLGAEVLSRAGAQVVGHATLERALLDRRGTYLASLARLVGAAEALGTDVAGIDVAVAGEMSIDLGGRSLVLRSWPNGHTGSDLTAEDREAGLLVAGDLVFDTHIPALDGSLVGWQAHTDALAAQDYALVVPGHGDVIEDWPAGVIPQATYLDVLAEDVRKAIEAGARLSDVTDEVAQDQSDDWALFPAYNPRNATIAFTELEWE